MTRSNKYLLLTIVLGTAFAVTGCIVQIIQIIQIRQIHLPQTAITTKTACLNKPNQPVLADSAMTVRKLQKYPP